MSQKSEDLLKAENKELIDDFKTTKFKIIRFLSIIFNVILILAQIKLLRNHDVKMQTYGVFILCNISILVMLLAPNLTKFTLKKVIKYTYIPTMISVYLFISQVFS